jgi:hypothetical protein
MILIETMRKLDIQDTGEAKQETLHRKLKR